MSQDEETAVESIVVTEQELAQAFPAIESQPGADRNPARCYIGRLSSGSRATVEGSIKVIAAILAPGKTIDEIPWHLLRYQHTRYLRAKIVEAYSAATARKHLSVLRGVLEEARVLQLMSGEDCAMACKIKGPGDDPNKQPVGRALDEDEVRRLIAACDVTTLSGSRDAAMIGLLFGGALRRAEASSAKVTGVERNAAAVEVIGKGDKRRRVPLPKDAALLIQAWLFQRGREDGPLLCSLDAGGKLKRKSGRLQRISTSGIYKCLGDLAKAAGIEDISPHDARRTRITQLLDQGKSMAIVQMIAGHKRVETTAKYNRSNQRAMQRVAEEVSMLGDGNDANYESGATLSA